MLINTCHFDYKYRKYGIFVNIPAVYIYSVLRQMTPTVLNSLYRSELELTDILLIKKNLLISHSRDNFLTLFKA